MKNATFARFGVGVAVLLVAATVWSTSALADRVSTNSTTEEIICSTANGNSCPGLATPTIPDPVFTATITETGLNQTLPFFAAAGDVVLFEPGGNGAVSDVLHFNGPVGGIGNSVFLYSDLEPGEVDPTDVPLPPGFAPSPNAVFGNEVGPEGGPNGAVYVVLNPDGTQNSVYTIISDPAPTATPEPGTVSTLGLALGIGALLLRRKLANG